MKIILTLILLLLSCPAYACAFLEHGNPKVGSEVSDVSAVELTFSDKVYAEKSSITVTDAGGKVYSTGKTYGKDDDTAYIATKVNTLPPGTYTVSWSVFCDCGDLTPGHYKFTVR